MNKKIAVLGSRFAMDQMIRFIDDSIDSKFVFVVNKEIVKKYVFSDYILLDDWHKSYKDPKSILNEVLLRIN